MCRPHSHTVPLHLRRSGVQLPGKGSPTRTLKQTDPQDPVNKQEARETQVFTRTDLPRRREGEDPLGTEMLRFGKKSVPCQALLDKHGHRWPRERVAEQLLIRDTPRRTLMPALVENAAANYEAIYLTKAAVFPEIRPRALSEPGSSDDIILVFDRPASSL